MKLYRIVRAYLRVILFRLSDEEKVREDICWSCPKLDNDKIYGYHCGVCGCPLFAKIRDVDEGCPLGKW